MNNRTPGMPCPIDNTPLVMSERQGIEIDCCPTCRGVWLDRGELDKIIDRSATEAPVQAAPQQQYGYDHGHGYDKRRRKKSFLHELFD